MASVFIKEKLDKGVAFGEIEKKSNEIASKRVDFFVSDVANNLWMNDEDGSLSFNHFGNGSKETENMMASSWALSQLSTKIGMPSGYAEKCIDRGHCDLAADNVNTWLSEQSGTKRKKTTDYLIRAYAGGIDGILSSNYAIFDTPTILEVVRKTIDVDDYHVVGSYVSNERMHIRLIKDKMLSINGEDLYPGIFIDSSDIGRTALNVNFGIWKKVCTNGLCISKIGGELFHQRHMGITSYEVETKLTQTLKNVPALIAKSTKVIEDARTKKINFSDEKTFEKIMAEIRKQALVSEEEAKSVIELARSQYDSSIWGVVNAMTQKAQEYELDKRIFIENAAGKIINMEVPKTIIVPAASLATV